MNSPIPRKLSLVGLLPNIVEHSEQLKELCLQLPVVLGLNILIVQPNSLAGSVALGFGSFIMSSFLKFLGMVEIFLAYTHQLFEFR